MEEARAVAVPVETSQIIRQQNESPAGCILWPVDDIVEAGQRKEEAEDREDVGISWEQTVY